MKYDFIFLVCRHKHRDLFELIVMLILFRFVKVSCNGKKQEICHSGEAYDEEEEEYDLEDGHNFSD